MAIVNLGAIKFNWKGAYNSGTTYAVDDVVSSGGNSYVCIQAHSTTQAVGNATAYWNIMSSAGVAGAEGGTTTLTTRGDVLYKGASTVERLPKGTAGYFLKQGANDPEWGAVDLTNLSASNLSSGTIPNARYGTPTFSGANLTNLPSGASKYGQVVFVASSTAVSSVTSVGSFSDFTNAPTVAITPTASTSKVLVEYNLQVSGGGSSGGFELALTDSSNNVLATTGTYGSQTAGITIRALHTANTTNAVSYKLRGKVISGGGHHYYIYAGSSPNQTVYCSATEILA